MISHSEFIKLSPDQVLAVARDDWHLKHPVIEALTEQALSGAMLLDDCVDLDELFDAELATKCRVHCEYFKKKILLMRNQLVSTEKSFPKSFQHARREMAETRQPGSGYVLKETLSSWRSVYGARKMVVNEARKQGARGGIAVDGMNIIVDLWFPQTTAGVFFRAIEEVCENPMSQLRCPPLHFQDGMCGDRRFIEPYAPLHDSPNMVSTSLSTTATRDLRGTLHRYHSIDKEDLRYGEIIHIVPSACLKNGKKVGAWDLLFGSANMNKMSNDDVPVVDITFVDAHGTEERDGRVFAVLQVDFTRAGSVHIVFPDDCVQFSPSVYRAKVGVESCHWERFRLALEWRREAVEDAIRRQKAGESLHNNNRPAGSAWWVYPLATGLSEFKRARSPEVQCAQVDDSEQDM